MNARNTIALLACVLTSAACTTMRPAEDPMLVKLEEIERRLEAVERVLANGSLVDLTMQVDALERQAAEIRGQAEQIQHESETTETRQRDLYVDLDERVHALEERLKGAGSVNVMDGGSLPPGQLPLPGGSDRDNYQAAFELLKQQRYEPAAMAFRQFLVSYPDSQLADNAQYWLAESYYVTDQFEEGLQQFAVVINKYPDSRKVPDALLKMGYCNYELERWDDARSALQRVQKDYAETTAARLAEQRLARMAEEQR